MSKNPNQLRSKSEAEPSNAKSSWDRLSEEVPFSDTNQASKSESGSPNDFMPAESREEIELAKEAEQIREQITAVYDKMNSPNYQRNIRFDMGAMDVRDTDPATPFEATEKLREKLSQIEDRRSELASERKAAAKETQHNRLISDLVQENLQETAIERSHVAEEEWIAERNRQALMTPYEKAKARANTYLKDHPVPRDVAGEVGRHDHYRVKSLLRNVERKRERISSGEEDFLSKIFDKRNLKKDLAELQRYGYPESPDFKKMTHETLIFDGEDFGERRYRDFQFATRFISAMDKKQLKQAKASLKRQHIKSFPENWRDKNFTNHEISVIRQTLEVYAKPDEA